ncbi:MAG: HIT domain-containing protein [Candidatus Aenigmarchaeota archaeon]|nr:HIT domain-containing protein [Candidatus Aenigmarchaeota archaeon]
MDDCIFCKIARREIAVKAVGMNDSAIAFLDINPVAPGHTVVITKKHAATLMDMNDADIASLFSLVRTATRQIKAGLKCDGFNIGLNQEKAGGQAIPHVHVHVIPRFDGDGGGSMHSIVRNPPKENIDAVYKKIKDAEPVKEQAPEPEPEQEAKPVEKEEDRTKKMLKDWELDL